MSNSLVLHENYSRGKWSFSPSGSGIYNIHYKDSDGVDIFIGTIASSEADTVLIANSKAMYEHLRFIATYINSHDYNPDFLGSILDCIEWLTSQLLLQMDYEYYKLNQQPKPDNTVEDDTQLYV